MGIQITRTGDILGMSEQIFFPELIFLNFSFEILWIMEKKNEAANVLATIYVSKLNTEIVT